MRAWRAASEARYPAIPPGAPVGAPPADAGTYAVSPPAAVAAPKEKKDWPHNCYVPMKANRARVRVSGPGLVRICISRRNRIRIHADAVYLITDKSLN